MLNKFINKLKIIYTSVFVLKLIRKCTEHKLKQLQHGFLYKVDTFLAERICF